MLVPIFGFASPDIAIGTGLMSRLFWIVACVVGLAGIAALIWRNSPVYAHRYRLTIVVAVDGEIHSGSSVIEIQYREWPQRIRELFLGGRQYTLSVHGQAVLVDLGARGALVAVLRPSADGEARPASRLALEALGPGPSAGCWMIDQCLESSSLQGRADLDRGNLPQFIWFRDIADPSIAQPVRPADFAKVIGDGARLASAQVEITADPIVIDIDKKLLWYDALQRSQKSFWRPTPASREFQLAYDMLVGGGK
jgi:hypothetical protein